MYQRIVVAYDASAQAEQALDTAANFAKASGGTVHVVHAKLQGRLPEGLARMVKDEGLMGPDILENMRSGSLVSELDALTPGQSSKRLSAALGDLLVARAEDHLNRAGVTSVDTHVVGGDAAEEITRIASEVTADLIVLGSRGLGQLKGLMIGSVSHKVLQTAPCACLIVK